MMIELLWWIFAPLSVLGGIFMITRKNPVASLLSLVVTLFSLAVLFLLMEAHFIAAVQVIVYAGAIVIMFVFVLAYLGGRADAPWAGGPTLQNVVAIVAAAAIALEVIVVIALKAGDELSNTAEIGGSFGSPAQPRPCRLPCGRGTVAVSSD